MNSYIRNELIELMYMSQNKEDKKYIDKSINYVIEQIEADLNRKIRDAKYEIEKYENDLEVLKEIKESIKED